MRNILMCLVIFSVKSVMAQTPVPPVYADPSTASATAIEAGTSGTLMGLRNKTASSWKKSSLGTLAEEGGRSSLRKPEIEIDFSPYEDLCDVYFNNKKKGLCEAKMKYLKDSYDLVYEILETGTKNDVRKGVQDQIWERYASICNTITQELEAMKRATQKNKKLNDLLKYGGEVLD